MLAPTLKSLNNTEANQVRANAFRHFLIEKEDQIIEDWADYAEEIILSFSKTLPKEPKWWLDRKFAAGMLSRPKATSDVIFNWNRFNSFQKEKLLNSVAQA